MAFWRNQHQFDATRLINKNEQIGQMSVCRFVFVEEEAECCLLLLLFTFVLFIYIHLLKLSALYSLF